MKPNYNNDAPWSLWAKVARDPISFSAAMTALSTVATIGSGVVGAIGSIQAGEAAKADAEFKAKQMEQKANEERAIGQRKMFERQREGDLQQSRLRSLAAASSGDTTDSGIIRLGSDIEERSELAALSDFYAGENAGRGYEDSAAAARATGRAAAQGARLRAFGSILSTGASLGKKYQ